MTRVETVRHTPPSAYATGSPNAAQGGAKQPTTACVDSLAGDRVHTTNAGKSSAAIALHNPFEELTIQKIVSQKDGYENQLIMKAGKHQITIDYYSSAGKAVPEERSDILKSPWEGLHTWRIRSLNNIKVDGKPIKQEDIRPLLSAMLSDDQLLEHYSETEERLTRAEIPLKKAIEQIKKEHGSVVGLYYVLTDPNVNLWREDMQEALLDFITLPTDFTLREGEEILMKMLALTLIKEHRLS